MLSGQAFAYDGFDADIATCTQGNNNVDLVTACTGLIDNAEAENAVFGMFYGLRASHSDDTEQNCSDARKSLGLADDEAIRTLSQQLIDENCRGPACIRVQAGPAESIGAGGLGSDTVPSAAGPQAVARRVVRFNGDQGSYFWEGSFAQM